MDTQDPWTILAEQGILFRPAPAYAGSWEYAMPTLTAIWYGPYVTREEALRAAIRHLLASATPSSHAAASSENLTKQLQWLRQQLNALTLTRARRGITDSYELEPGIADLREQIKRIEDLLKQAGEQSAP